MITSYRTHSPELQAAAPEHQEAPGPEEQAEGSEQGAKERQRQGSVVKLKPHAKQHYDCYEGALLSLSPMRNSITTTTLCLVH